MARCRICGCRCDASDMVNGACDDCRAEQQGVWGIRPPYTGKDIQGRKQGALPGGGFPALSGMGQHNGAG